MLRKKTLPPPKKDMPHTEPLEKGDLPAMVLAAFFVLLPAVLLAAGGVLTVIWFFFLRYA